MAGIIVAAAFAVCSGDASDAVTSAAEATVAKATARFELTSEFPDTSHPHLTIIEATGHVAMDASLRADLSISHMLIEIPGAGPTDIVVNGDDVYIRGGLFTDIPGCSPTEWIQTDPSRAEADMDDASILGEGMGDVRLFIYYLFGPSGTPRELGEESIDGWLARHYSTTLDLQKANDVAPTDIRTVLTADLAEMREAGIRTEVPADIWIDGSGLVRQTVLLLPPRWIAGARGDDVFRVRISVAGYPRRSRRLPALGANPDLRSGGRWDPTTSEPDPPGAGRPGRRRTGTRVRDTFRARPRPRAPAPVVLDAEGERVGPGTAAKPGHPSRPGSGVGAGHGPSNPSQRPH